MKKFWAISVATIMTISMVACGSMSTGSEGVKNNTTPTVPSVKEQNDPVVKGEGVAGDLGELESMVLTDVDNTISTLRDEYEQLLSEVDTYEKYVEKTELVEEFYGNVSAETNNLCIRLREYSIEFANMILNSDKSSSEKYEEWDVFYECIYEDAGNKIFDEIYDGILNDCFEDLYSGILSDGLENADYKEWSEVSSVEYKMWSDTGSAVYKEWSDCLSDVYIFWSSASAEILLDDMEGAWEDVNEFTEKIEKLKNGDVSQETESSKESVAESKAESKTESTEQKTESPKESDAGLVDGMRPEFKEAMDSYEAFYKKYCEMLKKYNSNPTDMSILKEYTELMSEADEMNEKFEAWEDGELNDAEMAYYVEVNGRVSKMLLEVSGL